MTLENQNSQVTSRRIRHIILEQSKRAHVGHIGSALSVADLIAALYANVLHVPDTTTPERDRFILSKGHAALALYAALFLKGWLSEESLNTYCADESLLGVHPEHTLARTWIINRSGQCSRGTAETICAARLCARE